MTKLHNLTFLLHFIFQRIAAFGIVGTAVKRAVSALPQHQLSAAAGTKSPPQGKPPISDLVIDLGEVLFPCLRVLDVGTCAWRGTCGTPHPGETGFRRRTARHTLEIGTSCSVLSSGCTTCKMASSANATTEKKQSRSSPSKLASACTWA